jgi:hypothetical protein
MTALEEKNMFSMFLNFDGFSQIHRTHRYFKNRCIDTSNINVQTILPIPSIDYSVMTDLCKQILYHARKPFY